MTILGCCGGTPIFGNTHISVVSILYELLWIKLCRYCHISNVYLYIFTHSMDNHLHCTHYVNNLCVAKTDATSLFRFSKYVSQILSKISPPSTLNPPQCPPQKKTSLESPKKSVQHARPGQHQWKWSLAHPGEIAPLLQLGPICGMEKFVPPNMDVPQRGKGEWVANIGKQYHDMWKPFRLLTVWFWYCLSYNICLVEK